MKLLHWTRFETNNAKGKCSAAQSAPLRTALYVRLVTCSVASRQIRFAYRSRFCHRREATVLQLIYYYYNIYCILYNIVAFSFTPLLPALMYGKIKRLRYFCNHRNLFSTLILVVNNFLIALVIATFVWFFIGSVEWNNRNNSPV